MGIVQGFIHQQLYPLEHSADAECNVALGAVDFESEVASYIRDGGQILRGVDQQGFCAEV